jgi:hypothetical protein
LKILTFAFLSLVCATQPTVSSADVRVLTRAHSHNDYLQPNPLKDALSRGFISVEADIHLVGGKLLVYHKMEEGQPVVPKGTLDALYLQPLAALVEQNGGKVYPDGPSFILLIDIKTQAEPTYEVLKQTLKPYKNMLTIFAPGLVLREGAVRVILSGNRPIDTVRAEPIRMVAIDGRLNEPNQGDSSLVPLVSDDWSKIFSNWNGGGPMPEFERKRLQNYVAKVHGQKKILRFWATPENTNLWSVLYKEGVDLIQTDDLGRLQRFLLTQGFVAE